MEDSPVKLSQRSGTDDSGKLYELKVAALLALRCVENPKIKNAWFASNVNNAYDFDDVILYVTDEDYNCTAYLMQLKHQNDPKTIRRKDFLYDAKLKKQSRMAEDFSLAKYQRSYLKITESLRGGGEEDGLITSLRKADKIVYVLYTNRYLTVEYDFVSVCVEGMDLLDTDKGGRCVYGFITEALEFDSDFLRQLRLYTHQVHVTEIDYLIKEELRRIRLDCVDVDRYLNFIQSCIRGVKYCSFDALTINDVVAQLMILILSDYQVTFPFNKSHRPEFFIWDEIISNSKIIAVEPNEDTREFLKSYVSTKIFKHYQFNHWNQKLSKHTFYKMAEDLTPILKKTVGAKALTAAKVYEALWLRRNVPLLLEAETSNDVKRIQNALRLSQNKYPVILLANVITASKFNCLSDLTHLDLELRNLILKHPVTVQERSGACLGDVVNKSMYKLIGCREMINIISNRFNIGNAAGSALEFYVPRLVSRILFTSQALKNIDAKFLLRRPDGKIIQNDSDAKDYHDLILVDKEIFELGRSYAVTKKLRDHQLVQCHSQRRWLNSNAMWTSIDSLFEQSACVINANPGMGKTELMNHVALNAPTHLWVIKVNLNEHNDYYKTLKDANKSALDHLKYFQGCVDTLSERIFLRFVQQKSVLVLLDGFDEIAMTYKDEATSIATSLHSNGFKVWVTTRPVTQSHLEEVLDTISRTLKPLPNDEQKSLLIGYFSRLANDTGQLQTITKFVDELLASAATNLTVNDSRFTELPLQTKLLADVFEHDLRRILETGIYAFDNKFDLIFLYDRFLEEKTNIFCKKFGDIYRDMRKFFEKLQQVLALRIVFPEEKLRVRDELKEYYEDDDRLVHFMQREGVVVVYQRGSNSEQKFNINFVHRTFAEFLAAKWLQLNYKAEEVRPLMKYRFDHSNEFLFSIFDRYMAKDLPLHLCVINRDKSEAVRLIELDQTSVSSVDRGGRTVLHIISCYGLKHPRPKHLSDELAQIIKAIPSEHVTDCVDNLLQYNALEYAISSNTFAVADDLCAKLKDWRLSLRIADKNAFFSECDPFEYRHLFLLVLKYFVRKDLLQNLVESRVYIWEYCRAWPNLLRYVSKFQSRTVMGFVRDTDDIGYVAAFCAEDDLLRLLNKGVDINECDKDFYAPLHYASIHNNFKIAKLLLLKGAKVNARSDNNNTALHLAISSNKTFDVAHALIEKGADVNLCNNFGSSPFLHACAFGNLKLFQRILPLASNITLKNNNGDNALHLALKSRNFDIARVLLNAGVVPDAKVFCYACEFDQIELVNKMLPGLDEFDGEECLQVALKKGNINVALALIKEGVDLNKVDHSQTSTFHYLCKFGRGKDVQKALPKITDLNLRNNEGQTALHMAIECRKTDVAHVLIDNGVDVNLVDVYGETPFLIACRYAENDIVKKLLPLISTINLQNRRGESALLLAIRNHNIEVAHELIDAGADVNLVDSFGTTPLLRACKEGDVDLVKKILPLVTDKNLKNDKCMTALHMAIRSKNFKVAHVLVEEGVDMNIHNLTVATPTALFYLCKFGDRDLIKKVLPMVTDLDEQNKQCQTALHVALQSGQLDVAHILIDAGADVNLTDGWGTPFHYVCKIGVMDLAKKMLPKVLNVNEANRKGQRALHLALENQKFHVGLCLIDAGSDLNLPDGDGATALHYACKYGTLEFVKKVLPLTRDINHRNAKGETALHKALATKNFHVAHALIDEGADVNFIDSSNMSALLYACDLGNIRLFKKILPMVADVNKNGIALHLALKNPYLGIAQSLVSAGADVNVLDASATSGFLYACEYAPLELVAKMLPLVTDVNLQNSIGKSALHKAVHRRNYEVAYALIEVGVDVNLVDAWDASAFLYACQNGELGLIRRMLPLINDINLQERDGKCALHMAILGKHFFVAHLLIKAGADVNLMDSSHTTVFFDLCRLGEIDLVQKVLPAVANVNEQCESGDTPLHLALNDKKFEVARALINYGANVNITDAWGTTAFIDACKYAKKGLIKKMLPMVADINHQNVKGETALHKALENSNSDVAHILVDAGADVNIPNALGTMPLLEACQFRKIHLVKNMLRTVKDVNYQNDTAGTALHVSFKNRDFDAVNALINAGADVNLPDPLGNTAIFYACEFDRKQLLKKKLRTLTDINFQNKNGETALHRAIKNENYDIACVLVNRGVDVNLVDASGTSAFHCACKSGNVDLVNKIQASVTDINLQDNDGKTALHHALEIMNYPISHALIDAGADVNLADSSGATALLRACVLNEVVLVKKILATVKDVNHRNNSGHSALHVLLSIGYFLHVDNFFKPTFEILQLLIEAGVDVNSKDGCGNTLLHLVCDVNNHVSSESEKFCKAAALLLLKKPEIEINLMDNRGRVALDLALNNQRIDEEVFTILKKMSSS